MTTVCGTTSAIEARVLSFVTYGEQVKCRGCTPAIIDWPVRVTFFRNEYAKKLTTKELGLTLLRDLILRTTATKKEELPWLKFATFGDRYSEKGSLRHDNNILAITGIELDYDGKVMPFDDAARVIQEAGLRALLYTSPSYTDIKPKWRILLPTSKPHPPRERRRLAAQVNALFGGVLAPESFTLSQSYFYGSVNSNPAHRAVVIEGKPIDLRDNNYFETPPSNLERKSKDFDGLVENILAGKELHTSIRDFAAKSAAEGMSSRAATNILCSLMDASNAPRDQRWRARYDDIPRAVATAEKFVPSQGAAVVATPYQWMPADRIPPRAWLYNRRLLRKFVSATIAAGGSGKTALEIAEILSMVSGKNLLDIPPFPPLQPLRVWLWNLEDPHEEITRRIQAAAKYYNLTDADLGDRLFVDGGRDQQLVIARTDRSGTVVCHPVVDSLVEQIIEHDIDVVIIDPFVSSHAVEENDNNAMDLVAKEWGRVADRGNCAVELAHHVRKGEKEVSTESARGGKALTDACRTVRVINRMSKEEGERAGVENHRCYFRTYSDKANLAPPAERSDWFKLESVNLGNAPRRPEGVLNNLDAEPGDSVGVVTAWQWPDPIAGVTGADFDAAALVIRSGQWREHRTATQWAGHAVATALNLDVANPAHKARIVAVLRLWISEGKLSVVSRPDERRTLRKYIEVAGET